MPTRYSDVVLMLRHCLGDAMTMEINDALHYYLAHPEWCSGDPDDFREPFMALLRAFDREGMNDFLPSFDILRGGTLTDNCEPEPHV